VQLSTQAKGRVERSFETAQDRLVKGLRVARVTTLEQANHYLESEYLPQWKEKFTVVPASADDAHRPLGESHDLAAVLCHVEERTITSDYTIRFHTAIYQIARDQVRPRLRQARVRVEQRRGGTIAVRWEGKYLPVSICDAAPKPKTIPPKSVSVKAGAGKAHNAGGKSQWMKGYYETPSPTMGKAIAIANATS
jgi:hypothetical protein